MKVEIVEHLLDDHQVLFDGKAVISSSESLLTVVFFGETILLDLLLELKSGKSSSESSTMT
jgi:hypothetical protein